jgi:hypothetical protein
MSQAQNALDAWRAAERRLEATTDPDERADLEAEIARLHEAYVNAFEAARNDEDGPAAPDDVMALV